MNIITQEYYANTGALKKAAETAGVKQGKAGKKVKVSIIESFAKVGGTLVVVSYM